MPYERLALSKTLDALEAFIDTQRQVAARALEDIQKLETLKREALAKPEEFFDNLSEKLEDPAFHPTLPERDTVVNDIHWSLFSSSDPRIFNDVSIPTIENRRNITLPSSTPISNDIHTILNEYRPKILALPPECEPLPEPLPQSPHRPRKRRRLENGKDPFDEEEEIISKGKGKATALSSTSDILHSRPWATKSIIIDPPEEHFVFPDDPEGAEGLTEDAEVDASTSATPPPTEELLKPKKRKLRPELFKVPWTAQEQHLLERFLLEIPDGEKHRWVKISEAMGGTRTSRQVASRVQKYNLKLAKFGL